MGVLNDKRYKGNSIYLVLYSMPAKQNNAPKLSSQYLTQKAAGYMLAAANAAKSENSSSSKNKSNNKK
jgi:hypothetical protein